MVEPSDVRQEKKYRLTSPAEESYYDIGKGTPEAPTPEPLSPILIQRECGSTTYRFV